MKFPILLTEEVKRKFRDCPKHIDWDLIIPHEGQALRNHSQSLDTLARRGGLSPQEIFAVMNNRKFEHFSDDKAVAYLRGLLGLDTNV